MKVIKDTANEYVIQRKVYILLIIIPLVLIGGSLLFLVEDMPWFVPALILAIGLGLLFAPYVITLSVNTDTKQIQKVAKSILKSYIRVYDLDTIKRFTIRQEYSSSSSGRGGGSMQFHFGADFNTGLLYETFFQVKNVSRVSTGGLVGAAISVARASSTRIRGYDILETFAKRCNKPFEFLDPVSAMKDGFSQVANAISGRNNEGNI